MTYMLTQVEVADYEAWKNMFDSGRDSVRRTARSHRIMRNAENPNNLFIQVEFPSADAARTAREELIASGAFERVTLKSGPTIVDEAEAVAY